MSATEERILIGLTALVIIVLLLGSTLFVKRIIDINMDARQQQRTEIMQRSSSG